MESMFCTQCGTKLDEAARFCISCGKPTQLGPHEAPPHAPPPPYPQAAAPPSSAYLPYTAASAPTKRLRKIVAEKKISGVCAGFAEYFDIDITLMRVIWVALLLLPPHLGVIAYIVCIFVLPKG